ncbi:hypothetical protein [Paracraurococcus lichenis]|uniref:Calcineurin-like phosphoesterase domain-containing protein n=1 Tax=Paracraurococcus lichenis TaxID=3064888 RepID=A0ABT9DTN8_9PROT|nr:hypothetical protein [Paracraurococcus sp. LOR1-02]MDO9707249.1 hypothetical protein [Paracraurococcus sp. LOR1-02]
MRRLLLLAGLLGLALPAPYKHALAEPVRFVAFGDMPYCRPEAPERCAAEEGRVARLMAQINAARPAFSIFVGDTKGGAELCTDEKVLRALSWMTLADQPLVYTPGDNEWTDCWQDRAGRYDPLERLALIRQRFFPRAESLGRRPMPLARQAAPTVENARWLREGVLFLTLHVPGSNNGRPAEPGEPGAAGLPGGAAALAEFEARDAANRAWLAASFAAAPEARGAVIALQADMFFRQVCGQGYDSGYRAMREAIAREAAAFGRPVLLINGDSHFYIHHEPLEAAPNLTRLQVPGEADVQAVVVTFDPAAGTPYRFEVIGEAGSPPQRPPCAGYTSSMRSTRSG